MQTIFSGKDKSVLRTEPFPHVVIENDIDPELCKQLIDNFPALDVITQGEPLGDNVRFSLSAPIVAKDDRIAQVWKDFIAAHVTKDFWLEILNVFGDAVRAEYPDLEKKIGRKLEDFRVGVRNQDTYDNADILLDAQICINSPVIEKPSSVVITHLDNKIELFAGLLYLRRDEDDSKGGDLYVSKPKGKLKFHGKQRVEDDLIETVSTVPYKKNTLAYFMNSIKSLHGVTNREPTKHPRIFVNIIAELKDELFNTNAHRYSPLEKIWRKLQGKQT